MTWMHEWFIVASSMHICYAELQKLLFQSSRYCLFRNFACRCPQQRKKIWTIGSRGQGLFASVRSLPRSMPFPKKISPGHDKVIILVVRTLQRSDYSLRIHISFQNPFPTRVCSILCILVRFHETCAKLTTSGGGVVMRQCYIAWYLFEA